jgi:two-component system KDP operon response regulator KdpE
MSRILVADDSPDQLAVQRKLLESFGYEVDTATSTAEAFAEIARSHPDLIVIDLGLPQPSDGLELIRRIRQAGHREPIVVLSGWPDDIYGAPEEAMVSRVLMKGNVRELLQVIPEILKH